MSDVFDTFLTTPGISPLGQTNVAFNNLTRIPSQIKLFDQLEYVLFYDNEIASIDSGTFNFPKAANPARFIELSRNQLTTIAPGAFKGKIIVE